MASYALSTTVARHIIRNKNGIQKHFRIISNCPSNDFLHVAYAAPVLSRKFSVTPIPRATFYENLADTGLVSLVRKSAVYIHEELDIPWWGIIVLSAAGLKAFSFPFKIYQRNLLYWRYLIDAEIRVQIPEIKNDLQRKQLLHKWPASKAKMEFLKQVIIEKRRLVQKYNCQSSKIIVSGLFEVPFWLVLSCTWRTLEFAPPSDVIASKIFMYQLASQGVMWSKNLYMYDHTYILPILLFLSYMGAAELRSVTYTTLNSTLFTKFIFVFQRGIIVVLTLVGALGPTSFSLFLATSGTLSLGIELLLLSKNFRNAFGIKALPDQNDLTYREVFEALKKRYRIAK